MTQGMTSLWNYLNKVYIQVSPKCPPFEISTNNAGGGAAKFYKGLFRKKIIHYIFTFTNSIHCYAIMNAYVLKLVQPSLPDQ